MDVQTFDEIARAAGVFEGERSITGSGGRLDVRVRDGSKRKPHWVWVALSTEAFDILQILWPWLGERRRAQALAVAWTWLGSLE